MAILIEVIYDNGLIEVIINNGLKNISFLLCLFKIKTYILIVYKM